jgi:hypothetical protein
LVGLRVTPYDQPFKLAGLLKQRKRKRKRKRQGSGQGQSQRQGRGKDKSDANGIVAASVRFTELSGGSIA